jgi:hypothetical protein
MNYHSDWLQGCMNVQLARGSAKASIVLSHDFHDAAASLRLCLRAVLLLLSSLLQAQILIISYALCSMAS